MTAPRGLHALARLHGIQRAYHDNDGRRVSASPEALLAALRALGVEVRNTAEIPDRVTHRRRALWERAVEPVVVVWTPAQDGLEGRAAGSFRLRTPARLRDQPVRIWVGLEGGGELRSSAAGASLETVRSVELGGTPYLERTVPLPAVPPGYHDLVVEVGRAAGTRRYTATLMAAPERAVGWDALPGSHERQGRPWGLFAPLYAIHERRPDAPTTPTYEVLGRFADRAREAGAAVIGTLPLLASFAEDPSPYSPVSRLFWNELYVAPESEGGAPGGSVARQESATHTVDRFLDMRAGMAERRRSLAAEARDLFGGNGSGSGGAAAELASFLDRNPLADEYARFRALTEARGPWDGWPERLRARDVRAGDYDPEVADYHLYVQWRAEQQLAGVADRAMAAGVSLYLDLPMGVHTAGYDVWRERALFATTARAGAPPDPLAPGGQDWGFPPLHPEASRLQGHRYFIDSIRKHLRFARVLRVDHVMQLHRMFWIPGTDARDGVYVRYPAEELYAVLCLESHRAGAVVVGEDLGTVPRAVRRGMRRRGLPGMYVLEFELQTTNNERGATTGEAAETAEALVPRQVPAGALAAIGTHDTPTFAGWWWGEDIGIRRELGGLTEEDAARELAGRGEMREKLVRGLGLGLGPDHAPDHAPDPGSGPGGHTRTDTDRDMPGREEAWRVQRELLVGMGESEAGLVLATVEDLWLEKEPQNVPGTMSERNWRRRWSQPLEALSEEPAAGLLGALNESRKGIQ